ncbi:glycosyltransferase family 2 protein [Sphingomonas lycopersici]|uniref:Glycosyltransferase n=1 Tax=Sphingomonas lycopersici TaxID=2951807 RepID=A0AA42CS14_9SPHN|nr:glycosyltransferase family A protein [Sphingomonas lycopersici]MCW6537275.1 glycosyltransferase [Sphingomonas lycopersici]
MTHADPLLSILIPTKDRYETLIPVVSQIASRIVDPRLEIVICDNSADRPAALDDLIASDRRIRYHHTELPLSIVDNTQLGIDLCRGTYLCFIGDDDLVSPHIMAIVEWLDRLGESCLVYPPALYWWSSVQFAKPGRYLRPGAFWLPKMRQGEDRPLDAAGELAKVLARGGVAYMELPRLYHGIVSRRAMERLKNRFGRFVPGSSPDMALSIALALTGNRYRWINYPVTVFGAARNSGGGRTAARKHYGRIEDQSHLPADILTHWDPFLPRIWSEQIIYPQTVYEVMSRGGFPNRINYPSLYGSLIAYEPHIVPYLWPALRRYISEHPGDAPALLISVMKKLAGRLRTELRNRAGWGMNYEVSIRQDVADVMTLLEGVMLPSTVMEIQVRDSLIPE